MVHFFPERMTLQLRDKNRNEMALRDSESGVKETRTRATPCTKRKKAETRVAFWAEKDEAFAHGPVHIAWQKKRRKLNGIIQGKTKMHF